MEINEPVDRQYTVQYGWDCRSEFKWNDEPLAIAATELLYVAHFLAFCSQSWCHKSYFRKRQNRATRHSLYAQCNWVIFFQQRYTIMTAYIWKQGILNYLWQEEEHGNYFQMQNLEGSMPDFKIFSKFFSGSLLFLKCIGLFKPIPYTRKWKRIK